MTETAAERYARDWSQVADDRKTRGVDQQDVERRNRLYVDASGVSATVSDNVATAGTPGSFNEATPADLAEANEQYPNQGAAWTTGQYVVLGDGSEAFWNGTAWVAGRAA